MKNPVCHYCQKRIAISAPEKAIPQTVDMLDAARVLMWRRFVDHEDAGKLCPGSGQSLAAARGREV